MATPQLASLTLALLPNAIEVSWNFASDDAARSVHIRLSSKRESGYDKHITLTPASHAGGFYYLSGVHKYFLKVMSGGDIPHDGETLGISEVPFSPGPFGRLPAEILENLLFSQMRLGDWLLDGHKDYFYALTGELSNQAYLAELLMHGLFVLPSERSPIASCPFPRRPFVLQLGGGEVSCPHSGASSGCAGKRVHAWARSKKVRRHANSFWLTVNKDFEGSLLKCMKYHEEKGGTWITDALIKQLWALHNAPSSRIRMWAFELWDRVTGELASASFGLSIGAFFHDFSMCTLIKDDRSCGAVITKVVGHILEQCGVRLWYWGLKCTYMKEYDSFGFEEVTREFYYRGLRAAEQMTIHAPDCLVQPALVELMPASSEDVK